jgi:arylformamidase
MWIDVSVSLTSGMAHWPDNPPVAIERTMDLGCGDVATVSRLSFGAHTGTHMDAPSHFIEGGATIDAMPFDATVGPAIVIAIEDDEAIRVAELERHAIGRGDRVLFKTRNSPAAWNAGRFVEDFVYLTTEAGEWLAARGVCTVGVDYLSVGGYQAGNGVAVHRALLGAGIWIIEGLDLTHVAPGPCDLVCLPLKILGGEGAPARAIVRTKGSNR